MDIIEELKEKYDYDEELLEALKKIIPAIEEYYGGEYKQLIHDAILSCNIHIQQKISERPEKYLEENLPTIEHGTVLGVAAGFYSSAPVITEDENIDVNRVIYLKQSCKDLSENKNLSILVHEMTHLIKSYKDEYTMQDGVLTQRSGISNSYLEKNEDTGKFEDKNSERIGIEEALNCYDEGKIMSIITGEKCYGHSYREISEITDLLMENNKTFREAFKSSLLNGDKTYIDKLWKEKADILCDIYEELCSTYQISFSDINTKEKKVALFERRDKAKEKLVTEVNSIQTNPMLDSLRSMVNSDEELSNVLAEESSQKDIRKEKPNIEQNII